MKIEDKLFLWGTVVGTHGLRGDLKVRSQSGDPASLLDAQEVFLRRPGGEAKVHRPARITVHKGMVLLRLEGAEDINAVQDLIGCEVLMPFSDLAELPEDEFYWHQLEGLLVVDRQNGELGVLEDMFTTAAHDIYVVRGRFGEVLIPAVKEMVLTVDLEERRMEVDLPEGLIPETDEV